MKNKVLVESIKYLCLVLVLLLILFGLFSLIIYPLLILKTLNDLGITTIIMGIVTITLAIIVFVTEKNRINLSQINNQIKLLDALLGELTIISSKEMETYYKCVKGNLEWYKEMLEQTKGRLEGIKKLDHPVNSISLNSYITKFDSKLCNKINFLLLSRTLSWINDKIYEINYHISNIKTKYYIDKYTEEFIPKIIIIIDEAIEAIGIVKGKISKQSEELRSKLCCQNS